MDAFKCFVKKGHSVAADKVVEHCFSTCLPSQSAVCFDVYTTENNDEQFTTCAGMRKIACLKLELPEPHTPAPRDLKVRCARRATGVHCEPRKRVCSSAWGMDGALLHAAWIERVQFVRSRAHAQPQCSHCHSSH